MLGCVRLEELLSKLQGATPTAHVLCKMADFSGDLFSVFQPDSSTSAALKRDKAGSKRKGDEVEVSDAKKLPQLSSLNTEVSIDAAEDSRTQETAVVDLEDQEQK